MKNWIPVACAAIITITSPAHASPLAFGPSGSTYWELRFRCIGSGLTAAYFFQNDWAAPRYDRDGAAIGERYTQCRAGQYAVIAGYSPSLNVHQWAWLQGDDMTIRYSGVASPPPKPSQPSKWQTVTYAPPSIVGAYTSVSVPLISVQTGVFKYDAYASQPWCAEIAVRSTITGDKPISVGIRGLAPCNYTYVISIVATLL